MPKDPSLRKILIIGSGPIVIGQGCEFDYSGVQACKALKEEGYEVVLVNSNPATIMTDPEFADRTYVEPITAEAVEKIMARERPDAVLPTLGGQTALNVAMELHRSGAFERLGTKLIGAKADAIERGEDRLIFKEIMLEIGLDVAQSGVAHNMKEARDVAAEIGRYPVIIRPAYTLGGSGGGIAYNREEFEEIVTRGLDMSPVSEVLIEESLLGWKEFEIEVMRDRADNCVVICSIENFDPMGVHTGDSITVAPIQTLTDREYQAMRDASFAVIRAIGVETGGSNIQFAVCPKTGRMVVIEMNPRVSRSSALASKATGFPIAKIAAKLAVGYTLDELRNDITRETPASFEPTIDYCVVKVPRFTFEKFPQADPVLTTQMKSVGEAMAIGRTFKEAMQKALRSLETGRAGFGADGKDAPPLRSDGSLDEEMLENKIRVPTAERVFSLRHALLAGWSVARIHQVTGIDPWFLQGLAKIVDAEKSCPADLAAVPWRRMKRHGFSDRQIAHLTGSSEAAVRTARIAAGVEPTYRLVDTCAAEFEAYTPYFYSTYGDEDETRPGDKKRVMILGGGPNRIGQGIEFDYCCVHAAFAFRDMGWETIMVNSNPETVSTDYDTSDKLYFEPLTLEDVLNIYQREKCDAVIVQFGGQTPLNLAAALEANGANIIGTSPASIEMAEDRKHFAAMLDRLGLNATQGGTATNEVEALAVAERVGYPVLVRPSFVLGGRAMEIVYSPEDLRRYIRTAVTASPDRPVLVDRFLEDATEVDVDCLSDGVDTLIGGVMEHIEEAGVHSGDSACAEVRGPGHGARVEGPRTDECAVRGKGRQSLCARGQSAGLAHRALRQQGHRGAAGQAGRSGHGRTQPERTRLFGGSGAVTLCGQGSGIPFHQVSRHRHHPRAGNALHRRSDGSGSRPRHRLRQSANVGPTAFAGIGPCFHQRQGCGQRSSRAHRPEIQHRRFPDPRDERYVGGPRGRGCRGGIGLQTHGGAPKPSRLDQKWGNAVHHQYPAWPIAPPGRGRDPQRGGGASHPDHDHLARCTDERTRHPRAQGGGIQGQVPPRISHQGRIRRSAVAAK
jgi:carbamoyl-phosphate synthase large subunit